MSSHNFRNRIGERYGHLLVIEQAPNIITPNGRSHVAWKCLCDGGNEKIIRGDCLQNGHAKSCGCQQHGGRLTNEIGNRYGKLTVIERVGSNQDKKLYGNVNAIVVILLLLLVKICAMEWFNLVVV